MPVVDRVLVQSYIIQQMAVGGTSYTSSVSDANHRVTTNGIRDAILAADAQIANAICMNGSHGRRRDFISTTAVSHAGQLPSHIGPLDAIRINSKAALLRPLAQIERERTNSLALTFIGPHYNVVGNRIYHNATSALFGVTTADVDYASYVMDTSTFLCKCSVEYTAVEIAAGMALVASVQGDDDAYAGLYKGIVADYMQMIQGGAMTVPSLDDMLAQAQAA